MKLTANQRAAIIKDLCANCDCWKEKGSADVLNSMTDQQLQGLKKSTQNSLVVNSLRETLEVPDEVSHDEFISVLNERVANAKAKNADDEELVEEDDDEEVVVEEDDEEEMPMNKTKNKVKNKGKKPPFIKNSEGDVNLTGNRELTEAEFMKIMPASMRATFNTAAEMTKRERDSLIGKLTANCEDAAEKKALIGVYNKLETPALRLAVKNMPKPVENNDFGLRLTGDEDGDTTTYPGTGGPTHNSGGYDKNDYLPLPTMNFAAESKAG